MDKHIGIGISIDGPKFINDKNRIFKFGNDSVYDRAMDAIKLLNEMGSSYCVSATVTPDVVENEKEVLKWLIDNKIKTLHNIYQNRRFLPKFITNQYSSWRCQNILYYHIIPIMINRIIIRYLKEKKDNSLDILGSMLVRNKIIYISCYIVVGCLFMYKYNEIKELEYIPDEYYPKGVVSYIKENRLDDMRLYNDYNYGSYLLYNDIEV